VKIEIKPFNHDGRYRGIEVVFPDGGKSCCTTGNFALDLRNALHAIYCRDLTLKPQEITLEVAAS
jgi:hypothetical protein